MTRIRHLLCVLLASALGACASSPPATYFTLDDDKTISTARSSEGVGVAIIVNLPDLIDRPQLVVRTAGHQVKLSEQHRWAEPLRNQIRRAIARDLDEALDSRDALVDVKVTIDIQRLEVVAGQRVDLVASWHVRPRKSPAFLGRSSLSEEIAAGTQANDYSSMVAAHRRVLRRLSVSLAADIGNHVERSSNP